MKLWCATSNPGKLREFRLAGADVEAIPNLRDIPPSPEDGSTFEENAVQKAIYYSRFAPGLLFADDSGLEVEALNGAPGIHSARLWSNQLLLERMANETNRSARFVSVIALAEHGEPRGLFRGEVEGEILHAPRGTEGFGFDPLFFYPPLALTFAEIPDEQKFQVSHRGNAIRKMLATLKPI